MARAVTGKRVCVNDGALGGRPIETGRYSLEHRKSLQDKVAKFWADDKPGDLRDELFLLRGLLQDYMGRFGEGIPMKYENIVHVYEMVGSIAQTVERISRMLNQTALTMADLQFVERRITDLLTKYIDEPNKRLDFLEELGRDLGSVREHTDQLAIAAGSSGPTPG